MGIDANLQVIVDTDEDWTTVYLKGDRPALLSLARLATELANVDQTKLEALSAGSCEHIHLQPDLDLAANSSELVIGRLDDKRGRFSDAFVKRKRKKARTITNIWEMEAASNKNA